MAHGFTVGNYLDAVATEDRQLIANGVHRRFIERYFDPVSDSGNIRHGFTMMAIACLMIEALESFRRGWADTKNRGDHPFCSFFDEHDSFSAFRGHSREFYKGIRCGILHQAETKLGWRILRTGNLLETEGTNRIINAAKFIKALKDALDKYRDQLIAASWDSELWQMLHLKMKAIVKNCE